MLLTASELGPVAPVLAAHRRHLHILREQPRFHLLVRVLGLSGRRDPRGPPEAKGAQDVHDILGTDEPADPRHLGDGDRHRPLSARDVVGERGLTRLRQRGAEDLGPLRDGDCRHPAHDLLRVRERLRLKVDQRHLPALELRSVCTAVRVPGGHAGNRRSRHASPRTIHARADSWNE